jgi:hypothetical protein
VTDDDVAWVCDLLRLPKTAFSGTDGEDPRLGVLKSNETLDIEACPGSGKTTLLVAKLAILARKWNDRRRGVCVLSHTNVARREIEQRLGSTEAGEPLLSYPHFVGTIHGFVNEFLAIPWLRSKPLPIRMIDDATCQARRWMKLPLATRNALETNRHDAALLKVAGVDFGVGDVRWGRRGKLGANTPTYQAIQAACRETSEEGFFCYDEMFLWSNELLDKVSDIRPALRERFPILFIDEVQDNSELQSALLFRLFSEGCKPVIRQRFGDANQAIYQHAGQTEGATTDQFPDPHFRTDIPNSHRFGQQIADYANPLGLEPQHLVGCGPRCETIAADTADSHAVFLFDDKAVQHAITTYARYLTEVFSEQELQVGVFTAVGGRHRPGEDNNLPRFVGHYWPEYDHELTAADPRLKTFYQYVQAGRTSANASGETFDIVEKVADGILRLVCLSNPLADLANRRRKHRYVLELLTEDPATTAGYRGLVTAIAVEARDLTVDEWKDRWESVVRDISGMIGGTQPDSDAARAFLEWPVEDDGEQQVRPSRQGDNIFRYPAEDPKVEVRVGSIHSVKGETHTATLVLDTYYYKHHLQTLKPWLLGQKRGRGEEGVVNVSRLKQHYVAMTRPSHLLCLAMREDAFAEEELAQLKSIGWRVARVADGGPIWL